jgi:hypothetical protein
MKVFIHSLMIFLFCFYASSSQTFAQEQYGHIRGCVTDAEDAPLSGVTVTLASPQYGLRTVKSSPGGLFRFLNLVTGTYSLKCECPGFITYIDEEISIRVGSNFDFLIVLKQASLKEDVIVTASSPIVDAKKTSTAFNVTEAILQEIPSARDPWVVLSQIPGINMGGENVGGSRSGEQDIWTSKGQVSWWSSSYNMDGIDITDMFAVGSSSRYYDFDSFEEIQVVTSGQSASIKTGGVAINIVTRRGGNNFEFLGRFFFTDKELQGDNRSRELIELDYAGNRINQITDYGFQFGGPALKNKLWFWLGYGVQDIRLLSINDFPNDTKIESFNAKLNFQLTPQNRGEVAFIYNDKTVFSRYVGPYRPPEATYDQIGNGFPLVKLEFEHTFSKNLLATFKAAYSWGWFGFNPRGGMDIQAGYDYYTGMNSGTAQYMRNHRPSVNIQTDGNFFLEEILGGDHEFQLGLEYRYTPNWGDHIWPGGVRKFYYDGQPFQAQIHRCLYDTARNRASFYVNDSYNRGRFMLNLGIRVDRENSWANELDIPANPIAPEIMPAYTHPAIDPGVAFWTFSPRMGLTFDLTGDGKTMLRANLARYSSWPPHLGANLAMTEENRAGYYWNDLNGDDLVSKDELVGFPYEGLIYYEGYDAFNPTSPVSANEIDPGLKPKSVDEFLLGAEREIFQDFLLGAVVILRKDYRWNIWIDFNRDTGRMDSQADWEGPFEGSITVDGETYDYAYWAPKTHRFNLPHKMITNRPDFHLNYTGLELTAIKRLSRRWMMNASVTFERNIQHYGDSGYFDSTNVAMREGTQYFPTSRWMGKVNFLYQLPWDFNVSGFAQIREGYALNPWIMVWAPERVAKGLGNWVRIEAEKYGKTRLPTFYNVDLSLSKDFNLGRYGKITVQADAFNIFNYNHTLWRQNRVNHPGYNQILNILSPRVLRLGVRYRF